MALQYLLKYLTDIKISAILIDPETWVDKVDKCKHIVDTIINQRTQEAGEAANESRWDDNFNNFDEQDKK